MRCTIFQELMYEKHAFILFSWVDVGTLVCSGCADNHWNGHYKPDIQLPAEVLGSDLRWFSFTHDEVVEVVNRVEIVWLDFVVFHVYFISFFN